jgi:hypothetical protein
VDAGAGFPGQHPMTFDFFGGPAVFHIEAPPTRHIWLVRSGLVELPAARKAIHDNQVLTRYTYAALR